MTRLHVIGAGFGRTGTLSLKHALDDLGFGPTYHGEEILRNRSHVRAWYEYARTGRTDWDALFAGYGSAVEWPVSCAWPEIADHYPEAKIVLTLRDPAKWWQSTATTVYPARDMLPAWVPVLFRPTREYLEYSDRLIWDGIFEGRFADREFAMEQFEKHNAAVMAAFPPERLLVFDVAEGWEPLCEFLEVPVPDHPFPHLNDTGRMHRWIRTTRVTSRALPVALAAGGAVGIGRAVRHRARQT